MLYKLEDFDEYLDIKDFSERDARDWKLLLESPSGVRSKIASLGSYKADDKSDLKYMHVDFIAGLFEDNDRYLFQMIYRNFKDGTMKIYEKEFSLRGILIDKENTIEEITFTFFEGAVEKFKNLLKEDNDDSILDKLTRIAEDYTMPLVDEA